MTRDETQDVMKMLAAAYPNFYHGKNKEQKDRALDIWAIAMFDFPHGFIANGFKRLVQNNKFPPTPAEVIEAAKASAMDWLAATSCEQYGVSLPPETWLCVNGRGIQYGQWSAERRKLQEATDAQDRRNALPPRNEPRQ